MSHFLIIGCVVTIVFFLILIGSFLLAWSAKKTLIRGGSTWSAKKFPIRRRNSDPNNKQASSLLESISVETSQYLQSEEDPK